MRPFLKRKKNHMKTKNIGLLAEKKSEQKGQFFITREYMMRDNIEKVYILVWGQFTNLLQSVIKGVY